MPNSLVAGWHKLRDGSPGRRFTDFYEDRQKRRQSGKAVGRAVVVGSSILLVLGGLAIGWLPGPGGFIGIFGLALLAAEYRPLARLLDRAESLSRRVWRRIRMRWQRSTASVRFVAIFALTGVAAVFAYAAWSVFFG